MSDHRPCRTPDRPRSVSTKVAVRSGRRGSAARHRSRHGGSRLRHRLESPERRFLEADLHGGGAHRVLCGGARHRCDRRPQEGGPGRGQGAGLFRGHDDRRPGARDRAGLSGRTGPRHEHRSLRRSMPRRSRPIRKTHATCRVPGSAVSFSTSSRRRRSTHWRATTCCRSCSSPSSSASAWPWWVASRASASSA